MSDSREARASAHAATVEDLPAGDFASWLEETRRARRLRTIGSDVPCGSCSACCRSALFIHVRPEDTLALASIPPSLLFAAPGLPEGHRIMGYNDKGECPMLRDGSCSIYDNRPQTCRDFDCRVFAATGIEAPDHPEPGASIAERVKRWRFSASDERGRTLQRAVELAATFITQHASHFPPEFLPSNPVQMALLAIFVHELFMTQESVDGSPETLVRAITDKVGSGSRSEK